MSVAVDFGTGLSNASTPPAAVIGNPYVFGGQSTLNQQNAAFAMNVTSGFKLERNSLDFSVVLYGAMLPSSLGSTTLVPMTLALYRLHILGKNTILPYSGTTVCTSPYINAGLGWVNPANWNYGGQGVLTGLGGNYGGIRTTKVVLNIAYIPTWLSCNPNGSSTTTKQITNTNLGTIPVNDGNLNTPKRGMPIDWEVYQDMVTKAVNYLMNVKYVGVITYIEVWNEPTGSFMQPYYNPGYTSTTSNGITTYTAITTYPVVPSAAPSGLAILSSVGTNVTGSTTVNVYSATISNQSTNGSYLQMTSTTTNVLTSVVQTSTTVATPTTMLAAYADLYHNTYTAIRLANSTVPIGGHGAGGPYCYYEANALIKYFKKINATNYTTIPYIQFFSYHNYDVNITTDQTDFSNWVNAGASGSYLSGDMPIFMTEWNYTYYTPTVATTTNGVTEPAHPYEQNNASTTAISYCGRKLSLFLTAGFTGACMYTTNMYQTGQTTSCYLFNNIVNVVGQNAPYTSQCIAALTPKAQTFRLMSILLGLGNGPSQIMVSTVTNSAAGDPTAVDSLLPITVAVAAINYDSIPVLCITSDTGDTKYTVNNPPQLASNYITVTVKNLAPSSMYNVSVWTASAVDPTTTPVVLVINTNIDGSVTIPSITLPFQSVVGLLFKRATFQRLAILQRS